MVFRLEDSVCQAQNLGPPEAPSRCKSRTTKASALVWASKAAKRDFCGSGLRSITNEEASGMLSLFLQRFTLFCQTEPWSQESCTQSVLSEWHFTTILVKSTTLVRSISYREWRIIFTTLARPTILCRGTYVEDIYGKLLLVLWQITSWIHSTRSKEEINI